MESNYSQFLWKASLGFASSIKFLVNFHLIDPGGLKLWDQYFSNKAGARQCWAEDWIPTEMKCKEAFMITLGPSILLSVIKWHMMIPQQPWVLFNRQATDCRHTSFYCTLLYCAPQMLSFLSTNWRQDPPSTKRLQLALSWRSETNLQYLRQACTQHSSEKCLLFLSQCISLLPKCS